MKPRRIIGFLFGIFGFNQLGFMLKINWNCVLFDPVSDTGIGSNLVEFRDLDHRTVHIPAEKWGESNPNHVIVKYMA